MRKRSERHRLSDRASRFADSLCHLFVRIAEALGESSQSIRFLERSEILALKVLDQRDLCNRAIVDVHLDTRHFLQSSLQTRSISPLAADDHEATADFTWSHQQRFENSFLPDGSYQLLQVPQLHSRLLGIRLKLLNRNHPSDVFARRPARELFHVVSVVTQFEIVRQSPLRHAALPPDKGSNIQPPHLNSEQKYKSVLCRLGSPPASPTCLSPL